MIIMREMMMKMTVIDIEDDDDEDGCVCGHDWYIDDDDLFDNYDDENEWIDIDDDDSNPTASRKAVDSRAGSSTQSTNLWTITCHKIFKTNI